MPASCSQFLLFLAFIFFEGSIWLFLGQTTVTVFSYGLGISFLPERNTLFRSTFFLFRQEELLRSWPFGLLRLSFFFSGNNGLLFLFTSEFFGLSFKPFGLLRLRSFLTGLFFLMPVSPFRQWSLSVLRSFGLVGSSHYLLSLSRGAATVFFRILSFWRRLFFLTSFAFFLSGDDSSFSQYEACVSDFGTSKILNPNSSHWCNIAGTFGYLAPELSYMMKVTEKCDVYSFGVLVLEIIKGEHPGDIISSLASTSTEEVEFTDLVDHRLPVPLPEVKEVLTSILILAIRCINSNPEIRPTMHQVSNNIAGIICDVYKY
ncbi:putative protein kinase RLK-Pelle-LRR-XI-1 family [Helianthus annuus]|nr:putative protein kinase RLK-Pelle-LRR-XI-1 family [Helianthus annuus]